MHENRVRALAHVMAGVGAKLEGGHQLEWPFAAISAFGRRDFCGAARLMSRKFVGWRVIVSLSDTTLTRNGHELTVTERHGFENASEPRRCATRPHISDAIEQRHYQTQPRPRSAVHRDR